MESIRVSAAIIQREDRIFCAHRATAHGGVEGGWEFPGGKLEPGESAEVALRREIAEELGARLSTVWLLDTVEHDYPTFHLSMDCFVCRLAPGEEPVPREHDDVRWLSRDELLSVSWLPADQHVASLIGRYWDELFADSHL